MPTFLFFFEATWGFSKKGQFLGSLGLIWEQKTPAIWVWKTPWRFCGSCWILFDLHFRYVKIVFFFFGIRPSWKIIPEKNWLEDKLLPHIKQGSSNYPIWGASNKWDVWFFGIPFIIVHCLGWQYNDPVKTWYDIQQFFGLSLIVNPGSPWPPFLYSLVSESTMILVGQLVIMGKK